LIKDLLDSHDDLEENFEELLNKFARGKKLGVQKEGASSGIDLRISKRATKLRPAL
jgi:hypothetical protein